jgi:hypothetical protein
MIRSRVASARRKPLFHFALSTVTAITPLFHATSLAAGTADESATVKRLLQESAEARADANLGLAFELLHDAVRIDPENQQARWQLGQMKAQDGWLSVEESQRRAASNPQQTRYEDQKNAVSNAADSAALARWCRKNNLDDEARVQWAHVLTMDPTNREALRGVQMRWRNGQLQSADNVKQLRSENSATKQSLRHWSPEVARWLRDLASKDEKVVADATRRIESISDITAIPAFEKATLSPEASDKSKNPAFKRMSHAFIAALRDMPEAPATDSLVRYSLFSKIESARFAAIDELQYRPVTDFVPNLLDQLAAPIKSRYSIDRDPDGSVHYSRELYREGAFSDWSYESVRSIYQPFSQSAVFANFDQRGSNSLSPAQANNSPSRGLTRMGAQRAAAEYQLEIANGEAQVAALNAETAASNGRILAVLEGATGQSLGSEPRAWWDWYQDYTDYYHGGERPVERTRDTSNDYILPPIAPSGGGGGAVECFVRGTPVWTKTGLKPIETLTPGDLVLSQNVNSGEIAYKPVLQRTLRPPGPTMLLSISKEQLRATRGHPFWVDGVGWQMTKELEDGAFLHAISGTATVESIHPSNEEETFNLVVSDFNTYFVGESGILVHDNVPRRPTRCVVPGLSAAK